MAEFIIQGEPSQEAAILSGLQALGAHVTYPLATLSSLANCLVWILEAPAGVTDSQLSNIPGIYIVEGKFFHSFYGLPFNGLIPGALPKVNESLAASLQLLPPEVFAKLPGATALSKILGIPTSGAGAFENFNTAQNPFSSPNVKLGSIASESQFLAAGDLDHILETIRVPQAHAITKGAGSVVAIVDSGIDPRWVPISQRLGGWSGDGSDPWVDSSGHGSMVAAILMAVAPECQVLSIKPTPAGSSGMSSMDIIRATNELARLSLALNSLIISNHSWGIWGSKI